MPSQEHTYILAGAAGSHARGVFLLRSSTRHLRDSGTSNKAAEMRFAAILAGTLLAVGIQAVPTPDPEPVIAATKLPVPRRRQPRRSSTAR